MDQNKMKSILKTEDIRAAVRIANHHPVPANQVWERRIPDPQFLIILTGLFEFQEPKQPLLRLRAGEILFIEPEVSHRFRLAPGSSMGQIAGMHLEFTTPGRWAAGDYRLALKPKRVTRPADSTYLVERFQHLAAVYESYQPYREALVNVIATEIVLILSAYWEDEIERAAHPSQRMEAILGYIRANLSQPLTRQSLAETFNLSAGYINQLFKVELGMSPSAVINRERAARAYQLLDREGFSVAESAQAVGFQDPFYFSRVFKQIYSIPPSQVAWRR
jgi:AraC-like DNA-binding protein